MTAYKLLKSEIISSIPGIVHGFGVRDVGVEEYLDHLCVKERVLFPTNQTHGNCVHRLDGRPSRGVLHGDAFITDHPGAVCFVRTADCAPILIADKKRFAVAAIHSGWRGTAKDIVGETLRSMQRVFGTVPEDCVAAIGPRICGSCFEVGDKVIKSMEDLSVGNGWLVKARNVDLGFINEKLLIRAGIKSINIEILPECTFCDETFASYRRTSDKNERQFNFILLNS